MVVKKPVFNSPHWINGRRGRYLKKTGRVDIKLLTDFLAVFNQRDSSLYYSALVLCGTERYSEDNNERHRNYSKTKIRVHKIIKKDVGKP